ncbi:tetraacyldisaccharide 4'-kinase [Psychroserpens algicola]|uniref:tetraacyldisaccharide 4'-kinase n=1 Tax=Psychroserpens algicola TaxID=1719034 RepID=UPI0019532245|nr:tetraacyldisaccharide 4'-kinase [Psychroserpens algicola]
MKLLRKILFPIVPIYFGITWLRNKFYNLGWMSSRSYDFPIICVGNLSTGGTGKTPTIEYLIRVLKEKHKVATLSRGYKRESSGFIIADDNATAKTIGDEPFQFYKKFDDVVVSVDANRQHGISQLLSKVQPDVILLDDAFQHRKVRAGLNILLTSYGNLYVDDIVLPTGDLREPRAGAKRADMILVTKCPQSLSVSEKEHIKNKLKPLSHQSVYFSSIFYSEDVCNEHERFPLTQLKDKQVTLVTGIANPQPLLDYLTAKSIAFEHLKYQDHHSFSVSEIETLKQKEIVLTTEKDYVRLRGEFLSQTSSIYYLPIRFQIDNHNAFEQQVTAFVGSN